MKIFFRKLHRWLGLLMALQIIAWMFSGFYFSLYPIAEIRGEHLTRPTESLAREDLGAVAMPAAVSNSLDEHFKQDWELISAGLVRQDDAPYWRIEGRTGGDSFVRLLGPDGQVKPRLSAVEAERRASSLLITPIDEPVVTWLETEGDSQEFRGRALPVWKISFGEPENLALYLHPWTGEILARRTDRWRLFDFLWMLHIMDFDTRDDFNHPLLQGAALLGLVVAASGLVFWLITTRLFRRRRISAAASQLSG
jgi:uncharacterized iron-regulated membrane protein